MPYTRRPTWFSLPLALLIELQAWLWTHVRPMVEAFLTLPLWRRLGLWSFAWLSRRPPWQAMIVVSALFIAFEPPKILAYYWIARHHWISGGLLYSATKLLEAGLVAVIERACRPALRKVPMYRRIYIWIARARRWARNRSRPWRLRLRKWRRRMRRLARPSPH
ncbi:hypothetical protein [Amantichitinum ursilacus]|uniref:hypothetical protein n=1 Tax=Amantichitinum ursilacus TaxID=857265 RepID=UPI0006B66697|nr:hypothetical protein [Amantichitinum ursilacus]